MLLPVPEGQGEGEGNAFAGLVIHESRHIPEVGQTFTFFGFLFEILKRQRNQIQTLRITPATTVERRGRAAAGQGAAAGV